MRFPAALALVLLLVAPASSQVVINGFGTGGGGGVITGSGTSGQVTVWNGASTITGFTGFTFDNGTSLFTAPNVTTTGTVTVGSRTGTAASAAAFDSTGKLVAGSVPLSLTSAIQVSYPNASVTGTTTNRLVKITSDPPTGVLLTTGDTVGAAFGICASGCGTTGSAAITIMGLASCEFDGSTTALNYVIVSTTTAGKCSDGGSTFPSGVTVIGKVQSTNVGAGTYPITVFLNDVAAATSGGNGRGTTVTINGSNVASNNGNVNDTTPAAPTGATNVLWQKTNGNPSTISAYIPVANNRRVCAMRVGTDDGSVLTDAMLGPQGNVCFVQGAATVVEINVSADGGTPNVIPQRNRVGGSTANLVSSALATASSGGIACSNTGGTTGINGTTTCTNTLQNTSLNAGDYIQLVSGTAGGVAKRMSIFVVYTIN